LNISGDPGLRTEPKKIFAQNMDFVDLCSPSSVQNKPDKTTPGPPGPLHLRLDALADLPVRQTAPAEPRGDVPPDAAVKEGGRSLTKAQAAIVHLAKSGESFFFSGCAGTGKTFTLMSIIDALPQATTYVTALTGIAASLLPHGTTLHSFAGLGHSSLEREHILKKVKTNPQAVGKWTKAKTLIIDEVSMMSQELFDLIDFLGQELRNRRAQPFGGIQVICCGDFFQLPPVSKTITSYCFESELWKQVMGNHSFELLQIFRQKDPQLINVLNDIRYGTMSDETMRQLHYLRRDLVVPRGIVPTQLVPVNATADSINMRELEKLPHIPSITYTANDWGADPYAFDMLGKITLFPDRLPLRVGAQVMLLKNNPTLKLWNGSRGVVIRFIETKSASIKDYSTIETCPKVSANYELLPVVRFSTGQDVVVGFDSFELEGTGRQKTRASRQQLPLRLCWAITIHKSQGMSLDFLKVDASRSFEAGQAYVALSRARSMEGLQVVGFDPRKCWCDPKVVNFYKNSVKQLTDKECEALFVPKKLKPGSRKRKSTDWIRKPDDDMDAWLNEAAAADEMNSGNRKENLVVNHQEVKSEVSTQKEDKPIPENAKENKDSKINFASPARVPSYSAQYAFRSKNPDIPPIPHV
jgi:ATP-dependent DNA helicase PIF1